MPIPMFYSFPFKKGLIIMMLLFFSFISHTVAGTNVIPMANRIVGFQKDTVIYAGEFDAVTLDPAMAQDEASYKVLANIFEGLVRFKPGTVEIEPCLAESWQVSADGKIWTFILRRNVKFHDGTPFNAEAVRFSFERQLLKDGSITYASFVYGMVDRIEIPDPFTVKFELKTPYAPFINNLAMPAAAPIVSPAAASTLGDGFSEKPVGTGSFRFAEWQKNKRIILTSNDEYWGGSPGCTTLVFAVINNNRLRTVALKLGLVDIIDGISAADTRFLEQHGIEVIQQTALDINYMGFYTNKEPFNIPAVRKAVSMIINRERITDSLYCKASDKASGPLPPAVIGYDPGLRNVPYDPIGAKEILSQNGYDEGLKITLITYSGKRPYNPVGGEVLAACLQSDLAKAGIETQIKVYSWQNYKEALLNQEGHAFLYGWISDNGDADNFLYTLLSSFQIENGLNISRYASNEVDDLLVMAQRESDPIRRDKLYRQAVSIIIEDSPWVFINHSRRLAAVSPATTGFALSPAGYTSLHRVRRDIK